MALGLLACVLAHADDLSDTYDALKRAEAAQNGADVLKYAQETSRLARIQIAGQVPPDARSDYQKERAVYLSQTDTYTEYSMGVAAAYPSNTPATIAGLVDAIIKQNPTSDYLYLAVPSYLASLGKESADRQIEGAGRILKLLPENIDALLAVADGHFQKREYQESINAAMKIAKRTHLADARETAIVAQAWMLAGSAEYQLATGAEKRTHLIAALDHLRRAAAIESPLQKSAQENAALIELELGKP
ncbi:MAG: hypothetical protein WDO18_05825 [Acidobacteriota bacterium]